MSDQSSDEVIYFKAEGKLVDVAPRKIKKRTFQHPPPTPNAVPLTHEQIKNKLQKFAGHLAFSIAEAKAEKLANLYAKRAYDEMTRKSAMMRRTPQSPARSWLQRLVAKLGQK